jgi:phage tail-like protein
MWQWLQSAVKGCVQRKNAAIVLLDNDGMKEAMRWNLSQAWIAEWNGPTLNALSNEVAIEEMVLVYETLQRDV